jgi:anti-sigma regulatory factor (Ser/Thr protein kinase)
VTATPKARPGGVTRRARVTAPRLALDQPFDGDGLHMLRSAVAAHAARLGVPARRAEHLVAVAHELAANAIRHGGGRGRLRLWRDGLPVYCQVSDRGPGIADPTVGTQPPDLAETRGRGMWICRQLCDDLTIDRSAGGGATVTGMISTRDVRRDRRSIHLG